MLVLHLLAAAAAFVHSAEAFAHQPTVQLSTGATISGLVETNLVGKQVNKYLGIPYTEPPVGDKRWKQSAVKTLTQDLNATAYGDVCHGNPALDAASGQFTNNEDCLYLNVFTPAGVTSSSKLPVMVWVHGGGFIAGAGNPYDGANLIGASGQKVIVVNFNYRLGALGFFSNEEILKEGDGANFGLRDQETAFLWVKKYISSFGGNPDDVTVFGESAGASSISYQLIARDGSQKLFHKAIAQSGGFNSALDIASTALQAKQSTALAAALGCGDLQGANVLACLRKVPARAIFNATQSFNNYPTIDNVFIKRPPFLSLLTGKMSRVPTIIGANTDDGWYFTMTASEASQFDSFIRTTFSLMNEQELHKLAELYPPSTFATPHHRTSEIFSDHLFVCAGEIYSDLLSLTVPNTYRYRFNYPSNEFGIPLVLHAKDLDYVFDRKYNLPNNTDATTVVGHFQKFWTNFAIYGSPNGAANGDDSTQVKPGAPVWPRYNVFEKKQIILQPTLDVEADSAYMPGHSDRCAFWYQVEARIASAFQA